MVDYIEITEITPVEEPKPGEYRAQTWIENDLTKDTSKADIIAGMRSYRAAVEKRTLHFRNMTNAKLIEETLTWFPDRAQWSYSAAWEMS